MIIRVYSGEDGQSHIEDVSMSAGEDKIVPLKPGADMTFKLIPDGYSVDWHVTPVNQCVVVLSGYQEVGIGDGTVRRVGPGDVILWEDQTGQGHTTKIVNGPRLGITLWLPD